MFSIYPWVYWMLCDHQILKVKSHQNSNPTYLEDSSWTRQQYVSDSNGHKENNSNTTKNNAEEGFWIWDVIPFEKKTCTPLENNARCSCRPAKLHNIKINVPDVPKRKRTMWVGILGRVPPALIPSGETEATFLGKHFPPVSSEWPQWEVSAVEKRCELRGGEINHCQSIHIAGLSRKQEWEKAFT